MSHSIPAASRRLSIGAALLALALAAGSAPARAADVPFTQTYDWSDPAHGYEGWGSEERDTADQVTTGWYAFTQGASPWGPGITIRPTGHGGDPYQSPRRGLWAYAAPGTLTIRQAAFSGVTGQVQDRQGLRYALYRGQGPELAPFDVDAGNAPATVTRTDLADLSRFATAWLATLPATSPANQRARTPPPTAHATTSTTSTSP